MAQVKEVIHIFEKAHPDAVALFILDCSAAQMLCTISK
jgi:hypothetical protein